MANLEILLEDSISISAQSACNACLVIYPFKHPGVTTSSILACNRQVEDTFLARKFNIDADISMHFAKEDIDMRDTRPGHGYARLCWSEKHDVCKWLPNSMQTCSLEGVPMCKVKDMQVPSSRMKVGPGDPSKILGPGARIQQKGRLGCDNVLSKLIKDSDIKPTDIVIVVDLKPGNVPEMGQACWSIRCVLLTARAPHHGQPRDTA